MQHHLRFLQEKEPGFKVERKGFLSPLFVSMGGFGARFWEWKNVLFLVSEVLEQVFEVEKYVFLFSFKSFGRGC